MKSYKYNLRRDFKYEIEEGINYGQNFKNMSLLREICSRPIFSNATKYDGIYSNAFSEGSSKVFGLQDKSHDLSYGLNSGI